MKRIDDPTVDENANGVGKAGYTDGDTGAIPPVPATIVRADALNHIQEEIVNAVEGAGYALDEDDKTQLDASLRVRRAIAGDEQSITLQTHSGSAIDTPEATEDDEVLGEVAFGGYDGTVYTSSAAIRGVADGNFSGTSYPTRIEVLTTASSEVTPSTVIGFDSANGIFTPSTQHTIYLPAGAFSIGYANGGTGLATTTPFINNASHITGDFAGTNRFNFAANIPLKNGDVLDELHFLYRFELSSGIGEVEYELVSFNASTYTTSPLSTSIFEQSSTGNYTSSVTGLSQTYNAATNILALRLEIDGDGSSPPTGTWFLYGARIVFTSNRPRAS